MNIQKVERFIELQERINREIDLYGQASISSCNMLMEIGDSLSSEEIEKVLQLITK
jgi:hypothetical protein